MDEIKKLLERISQKKNEWYLILGVKDEIYYSSFFERSHILDPLSFRYRYYASRLASYLINEEGELDEARLDKAIFYLKERPYVVAPRRENDSLLTFHFIKILSVFKEERELVQTLKKFRLPLCHKKAEEIIKICQKRREISNSDLRRAVLSACLTPLRQNLGSCFATAPAILIQKNQLLNLLKDLSDLLHTGKLTRVISGKEYVVPMNLSFGTTDLIKPIGTVDILSMSYNPGLIFALTQAGLLSEEDPFQINQQKCLDLLGDIWEKNPQNMHDLIRLILLHKLALTEEELAIEKEREKTKVLAENLHPFAYLSAYSSVKEKKVQEFYRLLGIATACFRTLTTHPLLKVWEFTLASLSDIKLSFTRWNLYISLGLDHKVPAGLGQFLYAIVEKKLHEANREVAEYQVRHERAYDAVRMSESLMHSEVSESRRFALQSERQVQVHEMQNALQMRDLAYKKANLYANLFSSLLEKYYELFQEYFQELYDPEIQLVGQEYNDSPAGFRLVYKHGRRDPSAWTAIQNGDEYISSLRDFFHQTESRIVSSFPNELREDLIAIITEITLFVQSPFFLEEAIKRMASEEKEEPEKSVLRKPWSYPSGGTMETLLKAYYRHGGDLHKQAYLLKGQLEPLVFYYSLLKTLRQKEYLTYSPSHAFIFLPDLLLKSLQEEDLNERMEKWKRFYSEILDSSTQEILIDLLINYLPSKEGAFKALFSKGTSKDIPEFYHAIVEALKRTYQKAYPKTDWDKIVSSFLFQTLPLQSKETAKVLLGASYSEKLFQKLGDLIPLDVWLRTCFASIVSAQDEIFYKEDIALNFIEKCRKNGLLPPSPLLFADTNWSDLFFGYTLSPRTLSWELWALDRTGTSGFPMTDWKMYLEDKSFEWGIYTNPKEYE